MTKGNYIVYHLHSDRSLNDSATDYKPYVDKAKELGQRAIAFTEHGNTFNWVEKKMYCDKNGIKYMHGVECYLTETHSQRIRDNYHTVLIAKNKEGFKELNKLVDLSTREDHFYYKPRLSFEEFFNITDNIIKISACLASPLNKYREKATTLETREIYKRLLQHYDYYEVQYHNHPEQIEYNKFLLQASKIFNKPLIAGTDTHSINVYMAKCRSMKQKAKKIKYTDEDKFDLTYKSYEEVTLMFKEQDCLPEDVYITALKNTNIMADSVEDFDLDKSFKYPKLYEDEESVFKNLIFNKLKYKIKNNIIDKSKLDIYKSKIFEELTVFKKMNMIGFMLFMAELVQWCWDNDIPVGFCRGSVGGSMIAYITDITDVDPVVWNTVFSRFVNEDRVEIGDIDLDFAPSHRKRVYNHIVETFGEDYTAYILANGTIDKKGTIDAIGRALEIPLAHVEKIKNEYAADPDKAIKNHPKVFEYFDGMMGSIVSQSMHPAGIVVSPVPLTENYGTFWADGKRVISINMDEVHEVSLVKYDILGLKNIEIIYETCKLIGMAYPKSYQINWHDDNVWDDITKSPHGIFQMESDFAADSLKKFNPRKINDLSLVNASIRPSGASYRDRLLNREINSNPSELIDELLKENNGFLVFQEDSIKFLKDICGLSGSEADNVRRAIGRKQEDRLKEALPSILEGYCTKSDKERLIAEEEAKTFLKIIEDSSNYQFGYNHSTGYSMIGYLCAYLRYYYPTMFITSYLNCAEKMDDIVRGTELAKTYEISIHPIKFGKSGAKYTVEKNNKSIYKGVSSIKHCNEHIGEELLQLSNKKYDNFVDLLYDISENTKVQKDQLEILIKLNFFREFGQNKKLLEIYNYYVSVGHRKQINKKQIEQLRVPEHLIQAYANTETKALYKDLDNKGLLKELGEQIKDTSLDAISQIKADFEYMEYTEYKDEHFPENYYVVIHFKTYKNPTTPYLILRNLKTGEEIKTRIKKGTVFRQNPFGQFDILIINNLDYEFKSKLINEKWTKTNETEPILNYYEFIGGGHK